MSDMGEKEREDQEDYKKRIKELIERVEKGDNSPEAYQQLLDKLEQIKNVAISKTKRQDRNEKSIVGFVFAIREYYGLRNDPNYPFDKEDLRKKITKIFKLVYKEILKPIPSIPHRWDYDNKRRIVENMTKVLGTEIMDIFIKRYKIRRLLRLKFEDTKYFKYYVCCWIIAFFVLLSIWIDQRF